MATGSTNSALGRVLVKRKLKARLSTVLANEKDPLILIRQLQHFSTAEPDAELIRELLDQSITTCRQVARNELTDGKASPKRAAQLMSVMDKSKLSPDDLDKIADRHIGEGERTKGTPEIAALEKELAELKKNWGKDKAKEQYAEDYFKAPDQGGMVNIDANNKDLMKSSAMQAKLAEAKKMGLTEAEFVSIATYSTQDFAYINPAVANHKDKGKGDGWMKAATGDKRGGRPETFEDGDKKTKGSKASLVEEGAMHAGMMKEALDKLKGNKKVYREADLFRGTRVSPQELGRLSVGGAYPFENFTSLSTDELVARTFAQGFGSTVAADRTVSLVFKLRMKAWDISGFSALPHEAELLIEPSQCKIVSIEDDSNQRPGSPPATVWKVVTLAAEVGK